MSKQPNNVNNYKKVHKTINKQVGISIIMFGIGNAISSIIAGRMAGRFGRNLPYLIGEILLFFYC